MPAAQAYRDKIALISRDVRSLAVPDELFASKAFIEIYEAPRPHLDAAIEIVCSPALSLHEKQIVAYSMLTLPTADFLAFASRLLECVETRRLPLKVLDSAAFPLLNIGRQRLIVHHAQPAVVAFLERMAALKELPESRKDYIRREVLTGNARRDYVNYLESLGRPLVE